MSLLLRARVSAFMTGLAVAGVFAVYQLRKDVTESHKHLLDQNQKYNQSLELRVAELEATVAQLQKA